MISNKPMQSDQRTLSCLLLAQKPRQNSLAPDQGRYALKAKQRSEDG
tara:strand:- start:519 stop:659 length:141 start_codon:yes stop_codon:yes gene_type:complete